MSVDVPYDGSRFGSSESGRATGSHDHLRDSLATVEQWPIRQADIDVVRAQVGVFDEPRSEPV